MPKTAKLGQNSKWPKKEKIVQTTKIVQNSPNSPKLPKTAKKSKTTAKIDQNGKIAQIRRNGQNSSKWPKQLKMAKIAHNSQVLIHVFVAFWAGCVLKKFRDLCIELFFMN